MKVKDLFNSFIELKATVSKQSTIILYKRIYKMHFSFLDDYEVEKLTPNIIDDWITGMKVNNRNPQRVSFDHELSLLKSLITYYNDFFDGHLDIIKKKHNILCNIKHKKKRRDKELRESEFRKFVSKLAVLYGKKYELLAMLQYYLALRVSEVVAIHYNDIKLNYTNPYLSTIVINKSIVFKHDSISQSQLQDGFKNGSIKVLPIFPELFIYLKDEVENYKDKYLFIEDGIVEYYTIKNYYNSAFKQAGLSYRGTHILRHGGCSRIFNLSGGNVIVASQLLGDSEQETFKTYAHSYGNTLQVLNDKLYNGLK